MSYATLRDGRIHIDPNGENIAAWAQPLPDSRWSPVARTWSVLATPLTALEVGEHSRCSEAVESMIAPTVYKFWEEIETPPLYRKTEPWAHQRRAFWSCCLSSVECR